jgi:hypothetical protein
MVALAAVPLLAQGCGTAASPTQATHSASASPSPSQQFTAYIQRFVSLNGLENAAVDATNHLTVKVNAIDLVNPSRVPHSKLQSLASRAQAVADKWDALRVDYAAMPVPSSAAQAHKWWLNYVHHQYLGAVACRAALQSWGTASLDSAYLDQDALTRKAWDQWWFEIRVAAKRFDADVPWGVRQY